VFKNKMNQGHYIGSTALYGYKKDTKIKGKLFIDEEAAEVVREVFNLFDQGHGKSTIARILNERKVPNPTEYKRRKGINYKTPPHKNGTLWKYFAISNMLVNPMYIGHMVQGRYGSISYKSKINKPRPKKDWIIVENTHEPIIDNELWERVQLKIQSNFKPFVATETSMFARKVKCINCGYIMRTGVSHGIRYLKCSTKHVAKNSCIGAFISHKKLSEAVVSQLDSLIENYLDKDTLEKNIEINNDTFDKQTKLETNIRDYERKTNECSKGISEAYFDKVRGLIIEDEFIAITNELRSQKSMYQKMLDEAKDKIITLNAKKNSFTDKKSVIEEFVSTQKLNRVVIDTLIDHIDVGKNDRETKKHPIEIHWNF
jgi:hypothetical protein